MSKPKLIICGCVVVCAFMVYMANSVSQMNMDDIPELSSINNKKRVKTSTDIALYKDGVFTTTVKEEGSTESTESGDTGGAVTYSPNAGRVDTPSMTQADMKLAKLSEDEAWKEITSGVFTSYPRDSFTSIKTKIEQVKASNTKKITVPVWKFSSSNATDLTKESSSIDFECNAHLADMITHIFTDIYNNSSKPVIDPRNFGCWVIRAKVSGSTASAHAFGAAIDINYSTNVTVNGSTYGNGYGAKVLTTDIWNTLPENQSKYLVLYTDSPVVRIFKAYGWYWGGDWRSTKDPMHLAYLGDGGQRAVGLQNYKDAGGQ